MKVSELRPNTIFKDNTRDDFERYWQVLDNRKIVELNYHCVDCLEEYDMDKKLADGRIAVDEIFGNGFLIVSIPTEQIDLGVTYQDPQRIIAYSETQVITGVSYKTKFEEVIELWPDDATSYIHINIYEWIIDYITTWRPMPSHKGYEMSPEGRVRNARTGQEVTPSWHGGIMCVSLQSGSQRTTRSANKMYRETYPELPQPLYNGKEKLR